MFAIRFIYMSILVTENAVERFALQIFVLYSYVIFTVFFRSVLGTTVSIIIFKCVQCTMYGIKMKPKIHADIAHSEHGQPKMGK